jgi:hypothetical protein
MPICWYYFKFILLQSMWQLKIYVTMIVFVSLELLEIKNICDNDSIF